MDPASEDESPPMPPSHVTVRGVSWSLASVVPKYTVAPERHLNERLSADNGLTPIE